MTKSPPETRQVRLADGVRRGIAGAIHLLRRAVRPEFRGRREYSTLISNATYSPWRVDAAYREVAAAVAENTLLDDMRKYELWQLSGQVGHLTGDAIEVGCWRGGAGCLVAARIAQDDKAATMFLCDTFEGVVKAGSHDPHYRGGEHADSDERVVHDLVQRMGLNAVVLKGIFPDATGERVANRRFKFAHIDVDVYQGSKDAFEFIFARMPAGGVIVFDDYGLQPTDGVRACVDELQGRPDLVVIRDLNGQAVVVKHS